MSRARWTLLLTLGWTTSIAVTAACGSFSGSDSASDAGSRDDAGAIPDATSTDGGMAPDVTLAFDSGKLPSGTITTVVADVPLAQGLFVDARYVYYTTSDFGQPTNEVGRIDKVTGEKTVISNGEDAVQQVATVDDDYVFWTVWGSTGGMGGGLRAKRANVPGAAYSVIPTPSTAWFALGTTDTSGIIAAEYPGSVYSFPTGNFLQDGGPNGGALSFTAPDGGVIVAGDAGAFPASFSMSHVVVRGGVMFWTNETNDALGGVYSSATTGGPTTVWANVDTTEPWGIDANDDYIVYTSFKSSGNTSPAHVMSIRRSDGSIRPLADGYGQLAGVVIVGADVYFAEFRAGGSIWRVPLDGSMKPVAVTGPQVAPQSLATDGEALYFTNNLPVGGSVMRMQL